MFTINEDNSIYATRGDVVFFAVKATDADTEQPVTFEAGDTLRITIYGKKNASNVVLQKDFVVSEDTDAVTIFLDGKDTKFGDVISKPVDYWYEIETNPDTYPQTIIGYDDEGAVLFKLFPEGAEVETDTEITEEDIPVVDAVLDATSHRPIENQAVAKEFLRIKENPTVGVVHLNDGKSDIPFAKILQWCNKGIPVMLIKQGEPPAYATAWNESYVFFLGGAYKTGSSNLGFVNVRFLKFKVLADDTVEDNTETIGIQMYGGA
jgi:hypothetical protein